MVQLPASFHGITLYYSLPARVNLKPAFRTYEALVNPVKLNPPAGKCPLKALLIVFLMQIILLKSLFDSNIQKTEY